MRVQIDFIGNDRAITENTVRLATEFAASADFPGVPLRPWVGDCPVGAFHRAGWQNPAANRRGAQWMLAT
jgi:hypothetical protein